MSNIYKNLLRGMSLIVLLVSSLPINQRAQAATTLPPVDMFQLPWDQGIAWVAIDGFDDGSDRLPGSPHNFHMGGAVDFAPRALMFKGEDTSNFWVTAAAAGVVSEISKCHLKINHANGFITEYQHLANIQVHLGDTVAQNQRLAVIANASSRQPVCPGSEPPDIPHLHFTLRPTMVGATFAGWKFKYNAFWNTTTFEKDGKIVTLFKPLLNVMSQPTPTATPTGQAGATPTLGTPSTPGTPQATNTPNPNATATPTAGTPSTPGTPVATNTPDQSATATPNGQATNTPNPFDTPTPTFTPASDGTPTAVPIGAYVTTTVDPTTVAIGETALASVNLNNVPAEGFTSTEFTCTFDPALVEMSNITVTNLFGTDAVAAINMPQAGKFIIAIAGTQGNKATTSGAAFTFDVKALQAGQAEIGCEARVSKGDNILTPLPTGAAFLMILGLTPTATPGVPTSTPTPAFTATVPTPTVTLAPSATPIPGWLTFTNSTFGFQFMYPPQGQIQAGSNDGDTIIRNLPIIQPGTNLSEKFLEVAAGAPATECKSLFQTQDQGVTVTINGIDFLKQTGSEAAAGNFYQWVAFSNLRNGVCVSMNFVLHSQNPSVFPTPPPAYDYAT